MTERRRPPLNPYVQAVLRQDEAQFLKLLEQVTDAPSHPWWFQAQRRWARWRQRHDLMDVLPMIPNHGAWGTILDRVLPLIDPCGIDRDGRTPLIAVMEAGDENLALRLLALGHSCRRGRSCLGRLGSTFVTITNTGQIPPTPRIQWPKASPLVVAAAYGMERMVDRLLPKYPKGHPDIRRALAEASNRHDHLVPRLREALSRP